MCLYFQVGLKGIPDRSKARKAQRDTTNNRSNEVPSEPSMLHVENPLNRLACSEVASLPTPKSKNKKGSLGNSRRPRKPMVGG